MTLYSIADVSTGGVVSIMDKYINTGEFLSSLTF